MNKEIYIKKQEKHKENSVYNTLQKSAMDTIQQLSGNLWTDFNEHDPGVTIMDVFNFALSELEFKCDFPFQDYLSSANKPFIPQNFGLYNPKELYPSGPVSEVDYRKLIFDSVQNVNDVWLIPSNNDMQGSLDLIVDLYSSVTDSEEGRIYEQIRAVFHRYRNLGETLDQIHFIRREKLDIGGEISLNEGIDASEVLARIYFKCAQYFSPGIFYSNLRELVANDGDWTNIFDGPLLNYGIIESSSLQSLNKVFYISDLRAVIRKIEGVKSINNLTVSFNNKVYAEKIYVNYPLQSFTISFPSNLHDVQLTLLKDNREIAINFAQTQKHFKKQIALEYGQHKQIHDIDNYFLAPKGNYQSFKNYYSIQNDFPEFYGINEKGVPNFFSEERKASAKQLKAYLLIIDLIIANTSGNLEQLPQLLELSSKLPVEKLPILKDSVSLWDELIPDAENIEIGNDDINFFARVKHIAFDLLDSLYGEKSVLDNIDDYYIYSSNTKMQIELLEQRARFLHAMPKITAFRAKAVDLFDEDPDNCPGLKSWFTAILGIPGGLEMPVTNIFSKFSLRLLSDNEFYEDSQGILNIDLLVNELKENFKGENIFDVPVRTIDNPIDNYDEFRTKIYLLHHNIVFESFLRSGIHLSNYKIIQTEENVFILVFHSEEKKEWLTLGRFNNINETINSANQLCRFLIELNRHSENLFIVEHLLLLNNEHANGYTLKLSCENFKEQFSMLHPVSREKVLQLESEIAEQFKLLNSFKISRAERGNFVIYFEIDEKNAIYLNREFDDLESAENFLEQYINTENLKHEIFFQYDSNLLFPYDFNDFGITVVLPAWSARFHNLKFREICEALLEERRPAHMKIDFLWLEAPEFRRFEKIYFAWREASARQNNVAEASKNLAKFIIQNK